MLNPILVSPKDIDVHFNGFITSSACVHKIIEHADDLSKLRVFASCYIFQMFSAVVWQQMRAYTLALFTKLSGGKALEDKDIVDWANAKVFFAHRFLDYEQNKVV